MICDFCKQECSKFFCSPCINKGNFVNTRALFPCRYADMRMKYQASAKYEKRLAFQIGEKLQRHENIVKLLNRKKEVAERIERLRVIYRQARKILQTDKDSLVETRHKIYKFEQGVTKIMKKQQAAEKRKKDFEQRITSSEHVLAGEEENLYMECYEAKTQLLQYIFPVSHEQGVEDSMLMTSLLGQQPPRPGGRWDGLGYGSNINILYAQLPANGDYTPLACYVTDESAADGDAAVTRESTPGDMLLAGLALTAQFVQQLSFWLGVPLPAPISIRAFCVSRVSERKFSRALARLNHAVLYLRRYVESVSRGSMNNSFERALNPRATLRNLRVILDSPNFGRPLSGMKPFNMELDLVYRSYDMEIRRENTLHPDADIEIDEYPLAPREPGTPIDYELPDWDCVPHSSYIPPDKVALSQPSDASSSSSLSSLGGIVNSLLRNTSVQ